MQDSFARDRLLASQWCWSRSRIQPRRVRRFRQTGAKRAWLGLDSLNRTSIRKTDTSTRAAGLNRLSRIVPTLAWANAVPFSAHARERSTN